jgi:hypothetical protein
MINEILTNVGGGMAWFEDDTHVFILRIWRERREIEGAPAVWRGLIEHVPSGDQRYFCDLDDVPECVRPYIAEGRTEQN